MSQNPMSASRMQVGGRQMPSWFPTPMGNATRTTMSTPPPLPEEPPPIMDESEYEEIDHLPRQNGVRRGRGRRVCNLCGDSNAVVCCEMCEGQIFCGGCNDVYHRHPKRLHHARKLIDAGDSRPPLPPKAFATHNPTPQQSDGPSVLSSLPPVPPPRRNKRFPFIGMGMRSATSSPTLTKKTFDPMGTLKRFVGGMATRPLPPTPKSGPPLPPKPTEFGRPVTPIMARGQSISDFDRRHSSPAPQMFPTGRRHIPQMMHEFQAPRNHNQSVSVANLSMQRPPSRNNGGYPEWEEEDYFARQRASSVSIPNRFPNSSQDASHFATLQRPRRGQNNSMAAPERPPPPLPPRSYPSQSQLGFQTSQSAFNINQMGIPQNQQFGNMHPWNYPPASGGPTGYPMEFQQAAMMGYTGSMRRTPSNQSMGGVPQQFFGWGPMGFGPPMSQQEMEMEIMARRGSESMWMQQGQQQPPPPPRPPSVTQSQPVTPQGSFRRKTRPSIQHEEQREQQLRNVHQPPPPHERFVQNQQFTQRPPTPKSGLSRMNPSPIQFQETIRDLEEEAALEYAGSDTPDGPWTCEHCTFVNPKSTKICTICCKTPAHGYMSKPSKYAGGKPETQQRKGSSSSTNENEDIPVIQSKLSISRRGEQQQATINFIESIERVKTPTKDHRKLSSRSGFVTAVSTNSNNEDDDNEEDDQELLNQTAQHHQIKINTKKPKPVVPAKSKMNDSNEDVYGSVPVQATTISPKIEIRRHPKMVSTGVSSSPPKPHHEQINHQQLRKPVALKNKPPSETVPKPISKDDNSSSQLSKNKNNRKDSSSSSSSNPEQTRSSPSSSSSSTSDSIKKPILPNPSTNVSSTPKQTLLSVSSTGVQVQADGQADNRGESGSESNRSGSGTSSSGRQVGTSSSANIDKRGENTVSNTKKLERKSSKGTSPPPQSISTQTYEELPASTMHQNSMSKTSMQSLQSDDYAPPKPIEMSEKALRYVRKARHHHEAKLKRSMSTHLYSASGDPWDAMDSHGKSMYRSSSRHSLMDDTRSLPLSGPSSRDTSPPPRSGRYFEDLRQFQPPPSWDRFPPPDGYFASLEDIVSRRRKDSMRSQDFELGRLLKEAEEYNYTTEDVQVALKMCGDRNPVKWLQENWSSMVETVQTLATKYGREKGENNQTGTISSTEAKNALRANRGNVWAAVTECIEQRRKKFLELQSRGTFLPEDVLTALTANHGNLDAAYIELSKAQLKPFLMRMWGSPSDGLDNNPTASNSLKGAESQRPNISGGGDVIPPSTNQTASGHTSAKVKEATIQNSKIVQEVPALDELEPAPRLELLVSNAAKVSQEIEKAILELKQSKQSKTLESASDEKNNQNPEQVSLIKEESVEFHPKGQITIVKSDEEESFVDAVSDYEIHAISPRQDSSENLDMSNEELVDEDEDMLEIEIDDTEANISEFIQNYEIVSENSINVQTNDEHSETIPTAVEKNEQIENLEIGHESSNLEANPSSEPTVENQVDQLTKINEIVPESVLVQDLENKINDGPATGSQITNIGPHMSPTDIEQLLSTLTTTFTEMGQFATDINFRYQIASEIHQQLAVAVNAITTQSEKKIPTANPNIDIDERVYEPVILSESVSQGVDKKLAKYKRLAAKRDRKSSRHKSPDARSSRAKDTSRSSSPGSSLSERVAIALPEDIMPDTAVADEDKGVDNVSDGSSPFPINAQVEIVGTDNDLDDSLRLVQDEDDLPRDEGEYNSSPDDESEISDEEFDGSENEKNSSGSKSGSKSGSQQVDVNSEEDDDEDDEVNGDEVPSSADDSELEQLAEGEYEEIDVNHSSDFEIYNNKDTEKIPTDEAIDNSKPFVPSGIEILEKASSPMVDVETKPHVTKTEKEMKMERLMTDGKVETGEKAELAVQLIDMNFSDEDSIYAANECSSLYSALSFLQQECDLCTGKFSARQMVSMLRCTHVCCHTCAKEYFTVQVRDKTIVDATCPFCSEPTHLSDDTEAATDYFNHLDMLLKSILEPRFHEMFQRKLRDWALAKTPNFKWCSKCSSGFITEPLQTRLICPDCNAVTCAICLEQWDKFNHDHRESKVKVCDSSSKTIVDYLNENNIECPRCHFRFALARGGCMHLTCTQCRHEFCSGCSASFRMGDKCDAKLPICERLGLHAHHPRNCLFYLRDKEPEILCKLLEENAIPYLKENSGSPNDDRPTKRTCQVPIQKETNDGLRDDICGKDAPVGYATVCNGHYVEYLGLLIWQNQLDPTSILSCDDLEVIIRRSNKKHPGRPFATTDEEFRNRLLKVIQDEIPL